MTNDPPKYYIGKYKKIQAMDVVMDFQEDSYNVGVALAYLLRAGHKPDNPKIQDLEKAVVHLQTEIKHLKQNGTAESNDIQNDKGHSSTSLHFSQNSTGAYQEWQEQILDREGPWNSLD